MRFALIARESTPTNELIADAVVDGVRWEPMSPEEALKVLRPGDAALGRLDVLLMLDGIDDGMWVLGALEARRAAVLNDAAALFATHDKLLTARLLRRVDVPHPRTAHVRPDPPFPAVRPPVVVKPRFGSGGKAVARCDDEASLCDTLALLTGSTWFEQQGVLVQELVPPQGHHLSHPRRRGIGLSARSSGSPPRESGGRISCWAACGGRYPTLRRRPAGAGAHCGACGGRCARRRGSEFLTSTVAGPSSS